MFSSRGLISMSLTLGVVTLIGLLVSVLALNDIYHNNEPDLMMEWNTVRAFFLCMLIFIVLSSITMLRILRETR